MKDINQYWESIYYHLRYEYEDNHQAIRILQIVSREKDITIGKSLLSLVSHNTASEHVKRLIQKVYHERKKKMKEL